MKKQIMMIVLVLSAICVQAQEEKPLERFFAVSTGFYFPGDMQINRNLGSIGFPELSKTEFTLGLGAWFRYKNWACYPGVATSKLSSELSKKRLISSYSSFNFPILYRVIKTSAIDFYAGVAYSFTSRQAGIIDGNNEVDFNNLVSSITASYSTLGLVGHALGPQLVIREKVLGDNPLILKAGYNFGLKEASWENIYGSVKNSPSEKMNAYYVELMLYIF